ncbi:MAG: folate family ECF transporter S component [Clostridia bacterium]|nr:folate family ECF transporter S component [Clostridia bacterium]
MRWVTTRQLTFAAMFAALAIVLSIFPLTFYLPSGSRITFREIPIFLCSFSLGPVFGGLCAFVADLVGTFITNSGKNWDILFSLNSVLTGILPGLLFKYVFHKQSSMLYIASSIIPVNILVSWFLSTLWLHVNPVYSAAFSGIPFWAHLLFRLLLVASLTAVQIVTVRYLYPVTMKGLKGGDHS